MSEQLHAEFAVTNWDENAFDEGVGVAKLTRADVVKEYTGEIVGTSATEWLMAYAPDRTARFVGIERIRGVVGGRHGSIVLQHIGRFEDGKSTAELSVLSGTNELKGVTGTGSFTAAPDGALELNIDVQSTN